MNLIAFYKKHFLVQILLVLSIVLLITLGTISILNIREQRLNINEMVKRQDETMLELLNGVMYEPLAKGENHVVQEQLRGLKEKMPDLDLLIHDANQRVSFTGRPEWEGIPLSNIIGNNKTVKAIQQTSTNVSMMATSTEGMTAMINEIAKDITEVNTAARDISNNSTHVQTSSEKLLMITDQLRQAVGKFKVS